MSHYDRPFSKEHQKIKDVFITFPGCQTVEMDFPNNPYLLNDYGRRFREFYWDGPIGLYLTFHRSKGGLLLSFMEGEDWIALLQAQTSTEKGNRWLFTVPDQNPRNAALVHLSKNTTKRIFTMNGSQKVKQISDYHGGFTVAEYEEDEWLEWADGKEIVPRLQKTYEPLPTGYRWGSETVVRTILPRKEFQMSEVLTEN